MSESKSLALSNPGSLFPSAEELGLIKEQANIYIASGLLPKAVDKPEKAILIMLKGRELGIPPLQALAGIYVIEGKTVLGAELMTAQVYRNCPGAMLEIVETTNDVCRVVAARPGKQPVEFKTTMKDAQAAGVTGKDNWRKYPAQMLRWRTLSTAAKSVFPDAVSGCYTPDELDVEVDASGNVTGKTANQAKAEILAGLNKKPETKEVESVVVDAAPAPVQQTVKPEPTMTVAPPKPTLVAAKATIAAEPEPTWDTGISVGSEPLDPLADYVLKGGHSAKGQTLRQLGREAAQDLLMKGRDYYNRIGKAMTGPDLEDFCRIEDYLRVTEPMEPGAAG